MRVITLMLILLLSGARPARADSWDAVDKRVQQSVFRLNVAIRVKLKGNQFAQLADVSPTKHYPVFATTKEDKGFRVVGSGTCFAARTTKTDGTYFLTNKHVVDFADGMVSECQRFYVAMRLHAEHTAGFSSVDDRFNQLMRVVNLATKKDLSGAERTMYQATVDSIWETYDNHLSLQADPKRTEFKRCLSTLGIEGFAGYFVHAPGSSAKPSLVAQLYRRAKSDMEPDLAILFVKGSSLPQLDLDRTPPGQQQVVQAIGYPVIKQTGVAVPESYEPAFTAGRVKQIVAQIIYFEAPVSKGDSGGPLINEQGKVVGVVMRRALSETPRNAKGATASADFAAAITVPAVIRFAPDLFAK